MKSIRNVKVNMHELAGWLVVCGIFLERYYEMVSLFVVLLLINKMQRQLCFKKEIIYFLLILCFYSLICIFLSNYEYGKFAQQYILLSYFILCYSVIFKYFKNQLSSLFDKYISVAYVVACIGLIQFILYYIGGINFLQIFYDRMPVEAASGILRITSIVDEPSYLSTLLTPAFIYSIFDGIMPITKRKIIFFLAIILTFSTITYVVVVVFLCYRYVYLKNRYVFYSIFIGLLLFVFIGGRIESRSNKANSESAFSSVIMKLQDTYEGFITMEPDVFETLNLSTYATMTNVWVALNAPNRLIGTGLGTHEINYYSEYKSDYMYYGLNASDGYSLINRLYSEFGILGILLCSFWVYKNYSFKNVANISAFFLILTLMIRGGHYVRYGFVFWVFFYYYSGAITYLTQNRE